MSKHTLGPWVHTRETDGRDWFIRPDSTRDGFAGADGVNPQIYAALATVRAHGDDFSDANAALIAAAPELLEALILARRLLLVMDANIENSTYIAIKAAIDKAEGRS